jgi:tol-pal system protein YbgF
MRADDDLRFQELEAKAGGKPSPSAANSEAAEPAAGGPPTMGSPPGYLGRPGTRPQTAAVLPPPPPPLAGRTPQEKYDTAFALLRNSNYEGATKAFQSFVAQYPHDPLAGNAMYWLGQIPYSQGQYEQAAVTFLDAYQKYPKSAKAGESLLKVGLSLADLNKKKEACTALQRFQSEFPDAADNLKRQAVAEKQKLGC